jgi:hypothetical protein
MNLIVQQMTEQKQVIGINVTFPTQVEVILQKSTVLICFMAEA